MRIALATIPGLYGVYFAREIQARFADAEFLVLCQVPGAAGKASPGSPERKEIAAGPTDRPRAMSRLGAVLRKVYWKGYEVRALRINPLTADSFWTRNNVIRTQDINDPANVALLTEFAPDFLLVFGGRIIRPALLQTARRFALNLHGGKLPEYRGANGIKWMLWNGDVDRVRATVHIAAPKVDAGDIVREASIDIRPNDTYRTIFARLHVAGVGAMIEAVEALSAGTAELKPQTGPARTYRGSEWSPRQEEQLDTRLAVSLRERGLRSFSRRVKFHAFRRLQRFVPRAFEANPKGAVSLLYHHVAAVEDPYVSHLGITISPEHFEQHVRYLTKNFDVVPFSQLPARQGDRRAVALTFDDGFRSVATAVLPIIERYGCPIKLYVCESLVDGGLLWLNKLSVVLGALSGSELEKFLAVALDRPAAAPRREPIVECIEYFDPVRTIQVVDDYFSRLHPQAAPRLYLNESEIRRLLDHPLVEIGSHTRLHYPQHRLPAELRHDEIVAAHRDLAARFGDRIRGFALPFGYRTHFTPAVVADIRKVDDAVVSAYGGYADAWRIQGEPEIRRIGVWGNLGTLCHQMALGG